MLNTYFDNGATSFPKPPEVAEFTARYLNDIGGPYGRSAYIRVWKVAEIIEECREILSKKMNNDDSSKLVFCHNATHAINSVIFGLDLDKSHILTSPLEHNAVTRPLEFLKNRGHVNYETIPHGEDGLIIPEKIPEVLKPNTKLIIVNHVSNVNGVIQPIHKIRQYCGNVPILIDGAQSFGHIEIDVEASDIDYFCFTGHKGLLGPTGTGGLYMKNPETIHPLFFGGTGSNSEELVMPDFSPDKFEAGTPNIAGIFGLIGSLKNHPEHHHTFEDFLYWVKQIESIDALKVIKAAKVENQSELISVQADGMSSSQLASGLFKLGKIGTRAGMHCAPSAHKTLGTFPHGTVRFSLSPYHTPEDMMHVITILNMLCNENCKKYQ